MRKHEGSSRSYKQREQQHELKVAEMRVVLGGDVECMERAGNEFSLIKSSSDGLKTACHQPITHHIGIGPSALSDPATANVTADASSVTAHAPRGRRPIAVDKARNPTQSSTSSQSHKDEVATFVSL